MKDLCLLKKKLAGYSTIAGVILMANHNRAEAQIIYHDIDPDGIITDAPINLAYYIDMNNDGLTDFALHNDGYGNVNFYFNDGNLVMATEFDFTFVAAMASCKNVSANPPSNFYLWKSYYSLGNNWIFMMASWSSQTDSKWVDYGVHKFAGVALQLNDGTHYGWIRMSHYPNSDTVFIEDYAYEATPDSAILIPCPTQVKNIEAPDLFNVFVKDQQLIIRFNQSSLPSQILLLNEVGMKLREQSITSSELVMNVSRLPAGIYFVVVEDNEKRQVKKVVIE
jgi:hypothetical protein